MGRKWVISSMHVLGFLLLTMSDIPRKLLSGSVLPFLLLRMEVGYKA